MKKDIAMKWVKALRSGKYKQGKDCLKDGKGRFVVWVCCVILVK